DVRGRGLVVTLSIDKATVFASEPVYAGFAIAAADRAKPLELQVSWSGQNALARPEEDTLTLVAADGTELPGRELPPFGVGGGQGWTVDLGKRDHTARLRVSSWLRRPIAPGAYTLRAAMRLSARAGAGAWTPVVAIAEAPLTVVADDAAGLGAVIDA